MGTVTAKTIIDKATIQLIDLTNIRWTRAELLSWLNDGMRQIVLIQPSASSTTSVISLQAGTRQYIPDDGWLLLNIYRNMGTTGSTPGRAVRIISREILDNFNPNWHTATATAEVRNYMYTNQDQLAFYVYPPNTGTQKIEINYSAQPTDLTSESSVIPIFDVFQSALVDYILYRACSKDAEYAPGVQLSQSYMATFVAAVQGKTQSEVSNDPSQALNPPNPAIRGSTSA
jgi:hypothetical protein